MSLSQHALVKRQKKNPGGWRGHQSNHSLTNTNLWPICSREVGDSIGLEQSQFFQNNITTGFSCLFLHECKHFLQYLMRNHEQFQDFSIIVGPEGFKPLIQPPAQLAGFKPFAIYFLKGLVQYSLLADRLYNQESNTE